MIVETVFFKSRPIRLLLRGGGHAGHGRSLRQPATRPAKASVPGKHPVRSTRLSRIENRTLEGIAADGRKIVIPPSRMDVKFLLAGFPENRSLVLQSRKFMQTLANIAAEAESVEAEARLIILPLPIKNWRGK